MIEFSGTIFGAPALLMRVEPLEEDEYEASYAVKVVVRDPAGDHAYQRSILVNKVTNNILGLLQAVLDELPIEAQVCGSGLWNPSQDKTPLELPRG